MNLDGTKVSRALHRGKSSAFLGENMKVPEGMENQSPVMEENLENHEDQVMKNKDNHENLSRVMEEEKPENQDHVMNKDNYENQSRVVEENLENQNQVDKDIHQNHENTGGAGIDDAKTELDGVSPTAEVVDLLQDSPIPDYFQESQSDQPEPSESFGDSQAFEDHFAFMAGECLDVGEKGNDLASLPEPDQLFSSDPADSAVPDSHPDQPAVPNEPVPDQPLAPVPDQPLVPVPDHPLAPVPEPVPEAEMRAQEELAEMIQREQEQLERKRASSRAWHAKWEKKGVPKKQRTEEPGAAAVPPVAPAPPAVIQQPGSFNNLMEARDFFIRDWIARSDLPRSNERRAAATTAWMASQLRADVMASRSGIQN